jgi:hypothetical protein
MLMEAVAAGDGALRTWIIWRWAILSHETRPHGADILRSGNAVQALHPEVAPTAEAADHIREDICNNVDA